MLNVPVVSTITLSSISRDMNGMPLGYVSLTVWLRRSWVMSKIIIVKVDRYAVTLSDLLRLKLSYQKGCPISAILLSLKTAE